MSKLWHAAMSCDTHFVIRSKHDMSSLYQTVGGNLQLVLPSTGGFRQLMLKELHCSGVSGHFGPDKIFDALSLRVWWPKILADVHSFICACTICQRAKDNV